MKPFMCGGRRYAFDITNPHDLSRLQRAAEKLSGDTDSGSGCEEAIYPAYLCDTEGMNDTARGVLALCRRYYAFFSALFPGQAEQILGDRASVSAGRDAFAKWICYLDECVASEREANESVIRMYEAHASGLHVQR